MNINSSHFRQCQIINCLPDWAKDGKVIPGSLVLPLSKTLEFTFEESRHSRGSHSWLANYSSEFQKSIAYPKPVKRPLSKIVCHKRDGIAKSWRTGQILALEDIVWNDLSSWMGTSTVQDATMKTTILGLKTSLTIKFYQFFLPWTQTLFSGIRSIWYGW